MARRWMRRWIAAFYMAHSDNINGDVFITFELKEAPAAHVGRYVRMKMTAREALGVAEQLTKLAASAQGGK